MKKNFLIFELIFMSYSSTLFAQDSIPKLYDFFVNVNEKRTIENLEPMTDSVIVSVTFKILYIYNAKSVIIKIGSIQNQGNILTEQLDIISRNGDYYLTGIKMDSKFWKKYAGVYKFDFGIDVLKNLGWVGIKLIDKNGNVVGVNEMRLK